MRIIYTIFFILFYQNCFGQSISVLSSTPTLNGKPFDKSQNYQSSIESVIANLERAPVLVERSKLSDLLEIIQDETNLAFDFGKKEIDKLNPENVDYVIFSNFITSPTSSIFNLKIECVKISGESILSKFVFPTIQLSSSDMEEMIIFESKVKSVLENYSFVDKLGVLSNATLNEINAKLEDRQREIDEVRSELISYIDYVDMAEIGMDGFGNIRPGFGVSFSSPLIDLMKKVIIVKDGKILPIISSDAFLVTDTIINQFPRYPFGYYIKSEQLEKLGNKEWRNYANEALKIFEKTTQIKNVNNQHIEAMQILKSKLGKY